MAGTVTEQYAALVATGELERDPAQEAIAAELTRLNARLAQLRLARKSSALGWMFGRRESGVGPLKGLYIYKCTLYLDNLYPGLPRLPITLAETTPLVFENLRVGAGANDPSFTEVITATANDVVIYSPYDPLTKVLEFDQITLGFSFAGLIEHQIDQVTLTQP